MRTIVTFEGNLAADPELRHTGSGKQVVEFTVLVNERRHNTATGEWEDGEPTRHRVKAFKQLGANIAESLCKGDRVLVHGVITTDTWTDKDTGDKRTGQKVLADIVGPSLRWATVRITKTNPAHIDDTALHACRRQLTGEDRGGSPRDSSSRLPPTNRNAGHAVPRSTA